MVIQSIRREASSWDQDRRGKKGSDATRKRRVAEEEEVRRVAGRRLEVRTRGWRAADKLRRVPKSSVTIGVKEEEVWAADAGRVGVVELRVGCGTR